MPGPSYSQAHKLRQKSGEAVPKEHTSVTIDDPGVVDESGDKFPVIPEKKGIVLPTEDPFKKFRTEKA